MTYRELLARLTDLRALAQQAQPGEKSGCMSSFDRASRFDETTGTYVDWQRLHPHPPGRRHRRL